jgi:alpha,alpha-trehalase
MLHIYTPMTRRSLTRCVLSVCIVSLLLKEFHVRKPTSKSAQAVLADFKNITSNGTFGQVVNFVNSDFAGEGRELEALPLANFNPSPAFLKNVSQPIVKAFSQTVHGYWTQLIRGTNSSTLCAGNNTCESSLIPLNHTFVVPGE